ncbi:MAG: hypothetical protein RBU30_10830 [Polyangia bacterium]|nr:hypothetical protein [Polyangia bacterium]
MTNGASNPKKPRPKTMPRLALVCLALSLTIAAGCSKDKPMSHGSEKKLVEAATPFVGIYKITSLTRNDSGCASEGPSALTGESDSHLVMSLGEGFMGKVLKLSSCKDIEKCKAYAKEPGGADFIHSFGDLKGKALTGVEFFTGFSKGKTCEKGSTAELRLEKDGEGIKIEKRAILVSYRRMTKASATQER